MDIWFQLLPNMTTLANQYKTESSEPFLSFQICQWVEVDVLLLAFNIAMTGWSPPHSGQTALASLYRLSCTCPATGLGAAHLIREASLALDSTLNGLVASQSAENKRLLDAWPQMGSLSHSL